MKAEGLVLWLVLLAIVLVLPTSVPNPPQRLSTAILPAAYIAEPKPSAEGNVTASGTIVGTNGHSTPVGSVVFSLNVTKGQPVVIFWTANWAGCGWTPKVTDTYGSTYQYAPGGGAYLGNLANALIYGNARGSGDDRFNLSMVGPGACTWSYKFNVIAYSFEHTNGVDSVVETLFSADVCNNVQAVHITPTCSYTASTTGSIGALFFGAYNCTGPSLSFATPSGRTNSLSLSTTGGNSIGGCSTNHFQSIAAILAWPNVVDYTQGQSFTASGSAMEWYGWSITFNALMGIQFSESGLSASATWNVTARNGSGGPYSAGPMSTLETGTVLVNYTSLGIYPAYWRWNATSLGYPEVWGNVSVPIFELVEVPVEFNNSVSMTETGLPAGMNWTVVFNGVTHSLTTAANPGTLSWGRFVSGGYTYRIVVIPEYSQSTLAYSGSLTVSTGPLDPLIVYHSPYVITFAESGLPAKQGWTVHFAGRTSISTTSVIGFPLTVDGTYGWSANTTGNYVPVPASGTIIVAGSVATVDIRFVPSSSGGQSVLTLTLGNVTQWTFRGGVNNYTASALWKNNASASFSGTIDLIGSWLSNGASNITIFINGGPVNAYLAGTSVVVPAGQITVVNGTSIIVLAQYTQSASVPVSAPLVTVAVVDGQPISLNGFIVGAGVFVGIVIAVDGVSKRKDWMLTAAGAIMLAVFVGVLCLGF